MHKEKLQKQRRYEYVGKCREAVFKLIRVIAVPDAEFLMKLCGSVASQRGPTPDDVLVW